MDLRREFALEKKDLQTYLSPRHYSPIETSESIISTKHSDIKSLSLGYPGELPTSGGVLFGLIFLSAYLCKRWSR